MPAEADFSTDALRIYEARVSADGRYAFKNLAPGRYWIIARPIEIAKDPRKETETPIAWATPERRVALRRAAQEAHSVEIKLGRCERLANYELRYNSSASSENTSVHKGD